MSPPERWPRRDALSRYWNALVSGAPGEELAALATGLTAEQLATIDRLRNRQRLHPDPAFVDRLERDLRRDFTASTSVSPSVRGLAAPGADATRPPWSRQPPPGPVPARRAAAPLLTALLVAITLVLALFVIIPRGMQPELAPVIAPGATPATPVLAGTPPAEASATSIPVWLLTPLPEVGAEAIWQVDGPAPTGTEFSSQLSVDPSGAAWVLDGVNGRFLVFDPDGNPIETWGEPGSGEGEFDFRRDSGEAVGGIAFTPLHADEDFYVADSQNARIQQFDADGNFVRAWGGRGTGEGQFLEPVSVTVSFDGRVYVLDGQRNDIQVFSADGDYLRTFSGPGREDGHLDQPASIAYSEHGMPLVADTGNHRVQEFFCCDPNRDEHMATFGGRSSGEGELIDPRAMATDVDMRVYVADRGIPRIPIYDYRGRFVNFIDGAEAGGTAFVSPSGVAIDRAGNLYVLDDNGTTITLQKFRLTLP